jgi:hypothetical protein
MSLAFTVAEPRRTFPCSDLGRTWVRFFGLDITAAISLTVKAYQRFWGKSNLT